MGGCGSKPIEEEYRIVAGVIDITNKKLRRFPDLSSVSRLEMLEELNISNNKIEEVDESDMRAMPNLVRIDFSSNKLVSFPDVSFLHYLEELNLENNCLKEVAGYLFSGCPKLEKLNLQGNQLVILPREAVGVQFEVVIQIAPPSSMLLVP